MAAPTPAAIIAALGVLGVSVAKGNLDLSSVYADPSYAANQGWDPAYVVLHDTGTGIPTAQLKPAQSLGWLLDPGFKNAAGKPIKGAHFLIGRDGKAHFIYAFSCYHAGNGGPYGPNAGTPGDTNVGQDVMNARAFGIEHESSGTSWDLTPAQVDMGARVTAALLHVMGKGVENALNHKDWTDVTQKDGVTRPGKYAGRKVDTKQSRAWWWAKITPHLAMFAAKPVTPPPTPHPPVVRPPATYLPAYPGKPMDLGATGPAVKALQKGFGLPQTGKYDAALKAKVKAGQRVRPWLWPWDGIAGPRTYRTFAKPI